MTDNTLTSESAMPFSNLETLNMGPVTAQQARDVMDYYKAMARRYGTPEPTLNPPAQDQDKNA